MANDTSQEPRRIAFVSTRIAGTDGVSMEIEKWAHIIEQAGHECYYITGESDRPDDRTALIEEMHFTHPDIAKINQIAFSRELRPPSLTDLIMQLTRTIRDQLAAAIDDLKIDALIAENCLTIPMNLPLGIALVHEIQEAGIACIAHHHDFRWERDRFLINCVDDYLRFAFPPALQQVQHVVINSQAGEEFSRRTGASCRIIPNVMDYANPPAAPDDYARQFRYDIGLTDDDLLVLQPTRVVARKGIEHSIELVRRLDPARAKLVITHEGGDEGMEYVNRIREFADLMGVTLIFADRWIADSRGKSPDGHNLYTVHDVYPVADLIAYPSEYEGFGNAFLEAIYYRKPIVCNRYAIYRTDIEPTGIRPILFDGFLTDATIAEVHRVLCDAAYREQMVEHNYQVAKQFFGYDVVKAELEVIVQRPQNIYRLLHRRNR